MTIAAIPRTGIYLIHVHVNPSTKSDEVQIILGTSTTVPLRLQVENVKIALKRDVIGEMVKSASLMGVHCTKVSLLMIRRRRLKTRLTILVQVQYTLLIQIVYERHKW